MGRRVSRPEGSSVTDSGVDATAKKDSTGRRRRTGWVIAAVVVVALGVTAAFVIPQMIHSQRVTEYTELTDELRLAKQELADAETTLQASQALTHARHTEALSMAHAVAALSEAKEPMLPSDRAKLLGEMGGTAADTIGPLPELGDETAQVHGLLTSAYVETTAAEGDGSENGVALPGSIAEMTIDQAIQLIATPIEPEEVTTVPDEDVTVELIEEVKAAIDSVTDDIARTEQAVDAESERQELLSATVTSMLPALQETAAAIDEYLAAIEAQATKANTEVTKQAREAAERVRDIADATDVSLLHGSIAAYLSAGEATLADHARVVAAEEEAEAKRIAQEAEANRVAQERAAAAQNNSAPPQSSSGDGWASGGLCNYWAPMGGGMYMAPC